MKGTPLRRSTKQRTAVLEAVEHSRAHPTADQVYRLTRRKIRDISLATVYRNLHLLTEEGKIREVQFQGDVIRYDSMLTPHEHFYCRACGAVEDFHAELPEPAVASVASRLGVIIERYSLSYYGLCNKCKPRKGR